MEKPFIALETSFMNSSTQRLSPEEDDFLCNLYTEYYKPIYKYIKNHINNPSIAKDITSDVFAVACTRIETVMNHPHPRKWLYVVAANKISDFRKRLNNNPELLPFDVIENIQNPDISEYATKDLEVSIKGCLSEQDYDRYLRYFIWKHSLEQMAAHDGVTKNNMSVRLARIRDKIKALL